MATDFGTKIAINAYKCISMRDSENVITYNRGFSWSANPKKTFLIAGVLETLSWQPIFGQNRQNYHKIAIYVIFCRWYISALNPCKLTDSNSTPAYERKTAKINVKNSKV